MRARNLVAVGLLVLVVGLALFARWILHDGLSARATPSRLEAFLARNARGLSLPSGAKSAANPVADSEEVQREARRHFADHCAVCHGNDGSGDNPMGHGLYPKPPDLRAEHTQKLSDGELFWIIENGVRFTGMPHASVRRLERTRQQGRQLEIGAIHPAFTDVDPGRADGNGAVQSKGAR